jgi:hypothetical protein
LIRACRHVLLPAGRRCLRSREKAKTGSSLPRWPFRRRKARRQAHASSYLHRARPRQSQPRTVPRAIVLVNACCGTLTTFSQGDWPLTCANAAGARSEMDFFRKAFFIAGEFLSHDASRAPHRDSKAMGRLGGGSPQLQLSAPYARRPAQPRPVRRYLSHTSTPNRRWQNKSRMLSASSDQSCCHFSSLLVGEESSESCPLIVLMGKKPAKHFKEKCFTF